MNEELEYIEEATLPYLGTVGYIYTNKRWIPVEERYFKRLVDDIRSRFEPGDKIYICFNEETKTITILDGV